MLGRSLPLLVLFALATPAVADGPKDNLPDNVRPIPPKGIDLPAADRQELEAGLDELGRAIAALAADPKNEDLLPDVEVYHKAVRYAVQYGEFFSAREVPLAKAQLKTGLQRARELKEGKPSWPTATGLVVRGYRSRIDGSVQPYGLVVPAEYDPTGTAKHRLDFWWHGRGETLSEVNFIADRERNAGQFTPAGAFVLHPYGRYCNANKFAGEVDTFECLEHARKHYRIDESRLVARGFSMGGAACWQFAVHYPTLWCAAAPGAGFAETPEFLNVFQAEKVEPTWYEQKLWHLYNATAYAENLFNLPVVAYSGEVDRQKQAADVMAREMRKVGLELTHVIGPKTAHAYEKGAKAKVGELIDAIAAKGKPADREEVKFVTYTLRYNECAWLTVTGLAKHWEKGRVTGTRRSGAVDLKTEGVTALTVRMPETESGSVRVDGTLVVSKLPFRGGAEVALLRTKTGWAISVPEAPDGKRHGLQGPIDDAFLDRFVMVKPSGKPLNEAVGAWAGKEMAHAVDHWRKQFRGDAPVIADTDALPDANLVLWGDPSSNAVLAKIADKLPVKWTQDGVVVGGQTYPAGTHVPILIYPNPLNPNRYVVLNSGFTFREYDQLNNARQVPKLPDYAVIDVTTPPNSRYPGKVVRAGFFGEKWELLPTDGR